MNEAEKERLIKKDIVSIENRVRHAFNQGYEMGVKELKTYKEQGGDAISRQIVIDRINKQRAGLNPDIYPQDKIGDCAYRICIEFVEKIPSVTPQQRTGRWIEVIDEIDSLGNKTWHHECSICGSDKSGWGTYKHCPDCGTKMEVSGCTKNI